MKAIANNAFMESYIGGIQMYSYLYNHGGWKLVIKEVSDMRSEVVRSFHN